MNLETYLVPNYPTPASGQRELELPAETDDTLDDLLHQRSAIHSRKLEILAAEIWWRLHISSRNLAALDNDKDCVQEMLNRLDVAANYHLREHQEKGVFYRKLFEIEAEKRSQHVECWRDVVLVMRDFLLVWETHEQTRARAMFLQNAGPGT